LSDLRAAPRLHGAEASRCLVTTPQPSACLWRGPRVKQNPATAISHAPALEIESAVFRIRPPHISCNWLTERLSSIKNRPYCGHGERAFNELRLPGFWGAKIKGFPLENYSFLGMKRIKLSTWLQYICRATRGGCGKTAANPAAPSRSYTAIRGDAICTMAFPRAHVEAHVRLTRAKAYLKIGRLSLAGKGVAEGYADVCS